MVYPPLGGAVCRDHVQYLAFALYTSEMAAEFLVFLHLISHAWPQVSITQLFLVPCSFLVFRCSRRHSSMCKHCSKGSLGPRSQLLTQTSTEASPASSLEMLHLGPHPRPTESLDDSKALTPWEALL